MLRVKREYMTERQAMDDLIERIREAMQDRVYARVARATGLSADTIRHVVTGKHPPRRATLRILADYLKLDTDE